MQPSILVFDSPLEQQSFEFFYGYSVPELTDNFQTDGELWLDTVLQAAMLQPSIRYAVGCLGALHRRYVEGDSSHLDEDATNRNLRFALQQYNASVKAATRYDPLSSPLERISALMTSILLVFAASLRGHTKQAIQHLRVSFSILESTSGGNDAGTSLETSFDSQLRSLKRVVNSLESQSRTLDANALHFSKISKQSWLTDNPQFDSLQDARDFYEGLFNEFQHFWHTTFSPRNPDPPPKDHTEDLQKFIMCNASAKKEVEALIGKLYDPSPRDIRGLSMVKLQYCVMDIFLLQAVTHEHGEMCWDFIEPLCVTVLDLCRQILGCNDIMSAYLQDRIEAENNQVPTVSALLAHGTRAKPLFTTDIGVVGALYTVAAHCRAPHIRREAIALLLLYPRQEGLYSSHISGRIAWESMQLEEDLSKKRLGLDRERPLDSSGDIPVDCRVGDMVVTYTTQRAAKIHFIPPEVPELLKSRVQTVISW
jgi:hypothetical protein